MKIQLKRSNVLENGKAKEPTAAQLEYGELAVNYNADDPAIFMEDSDGNIIRIAGADSISTADSLWIDEGAGKLYPTTLSNSVGIGTDNPQTELHVNGDITVETIKGATALATDADGKIIAGAAAAVDRSIPEITAATTGAANYTVTSDDVGHHIYWTGTAGYIDFDTALSSGDAVTIVNRGSERVVWATRLVVAGETGSYKSSFTLAQNGLVTVLKISNNEHIVSGVGIL